MRRASLPVLLLLALAEFASAQTQTAAAYRITGIVVSSSDGTPVRHCHLALSQTVRAAEQRAGRSLTRQAQITADGETDDSGNFSVALSAAGAWRMVASAPGYTTQAYLQHEDSYSSAIVLTGKNPTVNIRFELPPEATITGTVVDETGEPVRIAQVRLFSVPAASPDGRPTGAKTNSAAMAMTDDRGIYEFASLEPGSYKVVVDAKPWYATPPPTGSNSGSSLDPSLNVAYAPTWYPGRDDPAQAEILTLHGGDAVEADFNLIPVPAVHLHIMTPPDEGSAQRRSFPLFKVDRAGLGGVNNSPIRMTPGAIDIDSLAPGQFQVLLQDRSQTSTRVATFQLGADGGQTVNFNSLLDQANIIIHMDGSGAADEDPPRVDFVDPESGLSATYDSGGVSIRRREQNQPREGQIQLPQGRYEVALRGQPDFYMTGMSAKGAEVTGRFLQVNPGDVTLTIHVAKGKASVSGIATTGGEPAVGAMVLLVPAGRGDPTSLTRMVRDQTNTDGSFELANVIPGQYILVAIENGWSVEWKDPSTLNPYLVQGTALDLRSGDDIQQNLEAQNP